MSENPQEFTLLDVRKVAAFIGVSRPTIYARMAKGEFPKPIYPSPRCPRWRSDELLAWINRLTEDRAG